MMSRFFGMRQPAQPQQQQQPRPMPMQNSDQGWNRNTLANLNQYMNPAPQQAAPPVPPPVQNPDQGWNRGAFAQRFAQFGTPARNPRTDIVNALLKR